jgi:uncharacterized protein (DUF736 family)
LNDLDPAGILHAGVPLLERRVTVAKEITFPDVDPQYVFDRDCLSFRALAGDEPVECLVTGELLMSRFGAPNMDEASLRRAYHEHKAAIQELAREHNRNGWVQDRRVFLTTRFTRLNVTFGEQIGRWPTGRALADKAHRRLVEIIGPDASEVVVAWDRVENQEGRTRISLHITDPSLDASVSADFDPREWEDLAWLRLDLASAWSTFLRRRSRSLFL